jgi:GntR family transcriptional regulator/MocR family aminotransferase
VTAAAERGVGVYPVAPYFATPPPRAGLLLGYASVDEDAIGEGIARLAEACDALV